MNEANWINSILNSKRCQPVSRQVERALFERARQGDGRAADRLVHANLKFVRSVAGNYRGYGLTVGELFNEGAIGLTIAVGRFDTSIKLRFISYAVWWIRQRILAALAEQARIIRMPPRYMSISKKIDRARHELEQALSRPATIPEIAGAMGMKLADLEEAGGILAPTESLNRTVEDWKSTAVDFLEGPDRADDQVNEERDLLGMERLLDCLNRTDRHIVAHYFGLNGREPENLGDLGDRFGLTMERVRQRKVRALAWLRPRAEAMDFK